MVGGPELDLRIAALPAPEALEHLFLAAARELPRWLDHHGYARWACRRSGGRSLHGRSPRTADQAEQILVTAGAMQASTCRSRGASPRGASWSRCRAIRSRSTRSAAPLRFCGRRRSHPRGGISKRFARWRGHNPTLAYLIPDFHNPTGVLVDQASRRRAMRALRSAGTVVSSTRLRRAQPRRRADAGAGRLLRRERRSRSAR